MGGVVINEREEEEREMRMNMEMGNYENPNITLPRLTMRTYQSTIEKQAEKTGKETSFSGIG